MSDIRSMVLLANEIAAIEVELLESGGELTPELEQRLANLDISIPEKVDHYSLVMARLVDLSGHFSNRADALMQLSGAAMKTAERIRDNLKTAMETMGAKELQGVERRFALVNSNPSVEIENEDELDDAYKSQKVITKPNRVRILEDLKLGLPVKGAKLSHSTHLREFANTPKKIASKS